METILQRLTDLDEVQNALLVGKDGLIVAGTMRSEDDEMVGAMSAAALAPSLAIPRRLITATLTTSLLRPAEGPSR